MNTDFQILPLYERPEFAEVCAAWSFGEWGCHLENRSLKTSLQNFEETATNKDQLPLTWICLENNHRILGMARLVQNDHPDIQDLTPWLASVYVHPEGRRRGIAKKLCNDVENTARDMEYPKIYLFTHTAHNLYKKWDWKEIDRVRNPMNNASQDFLMMKELQHEGTE